MENSRSAIFALYHVLCRFSSREEPLSIEKIRALLKQEHSLSLTRTTLRSYLKALDDFGIRIAAVPGGRYLAGRQFEESEVYLLSNAVHSAHFISSAQSEALIRKLLATQSRSFEKQFHESVHLENRRKINSPALLQNIETLLSAIQQRKAVTFAYLHYDLRKQLVPKRQKPYHVYPYFMVMENDNVYLLCKSPSHPEHFAHYRVDKITDIDMTAETIPPLDDDMDPYTYTAQRKFMYSDAVDTITLRCHLR
ncbi:MAG: helix-turn-helix transcriptional regulator, partial [Merdibacter sp.]